MKVYLVIGVDHKVYGVFAEYDAAVNYRDRYLNDKASVVERKLHYGQQTAPTRNRMLP
jgi:hypothetical protein